MQQNIRKSSSDKNDEKSPEEQKFCYELSRRKHQKKIWKYHYKTLLNSNILQFSKSQLNLIEILLFSDLPTEHRKEFWLIITEAKREMKNNKNYYKSLLESFPPDKKTPTENLIPMDITRTFPKKAFFKDKQNLEKLQNILTAITRRNVDIGYCQGFNFIVGKILMLTEDEEETFWIFIQIIEKLLPCDYYIMFSGARKAARVIEMYSREILKINNEQLLFYINNFAQKCFISLYSNAFPDIFLYVVWDTFMVYGLIALYKTFLWIIIEYKDKMMNLEEIEYMNEVLLQELSKINNTDKLKYYLFMNTEMSLDIITGYNDKVKLETINENLSFTNLSSKNKKKNKICDVNMPFCLYNNVESVGKNFFIHRIKENNKLIEEYFFFGTHMSGEGISGGLDKLYQGSDLIAMDNLLIERQEHVCKSEEDKE